MREEESVGSFPGRYAGAYTDRRALEPKRVADGVPTATIEDAIGELPLLAALVAVANVAAAYLILRRAGEAVSALRTVRRP